MDYSPKANSALLSLKTASSAENQRYFDCVSTDLSNDTTLYAFGANVDFVGALLGSGVRFLIVGGLAVKHFCPEREVDDLDVMIDPTLENTERVIKVLDRFCPGHVLAAASLAGPGKQIPLKTHLLYLDVLTPRTETPDFEALWKTAVPARLFQLNLMLPSLNSLLALKRYAAETDADSKRREKHLKDVVCLQKLVI